MLKYAEMDLENCKILIEQDKLYNLIVYHSQQVVEKSLKVFLTYHGERVGNYYDTKSLCKKAEKILVDFRDRTILEGKEKFEVDLLIKIG